MTSSAAQKPFANDEHDQSYRHHIIWLDQHLDNFSNKLKLDRLREFDPHIKPFTCKDECIDYIRQQNDRTSISYIIFITSGSLSKKIIPEIEDCICILTIFIFCTNVENYEHLKYKKLRGIYDDTYELMNNIEMCIEKDRNTTDFSLFDNQHSTHSDSITLKKDKSKDQYPIRNLKEDQASFLWFYQCHNFMIKLENDDNKKAKQEMISCCRQKYKEDRIQSSIDEFNKQSLDDNAKHAIRLYTENSFIYQCTNNVLRKQNISQVYSYRYIIKLICRQLKEQHKQFIQEYKEVEKKSSLHLYRGQNLKLEDIRFLKRNINNLISLNGFVSTTRDERIAMEFVKHHIYEGLESVLMKIDVDMTSEHSVTFADISKFSKYPEEREVLLSVGTVFRVKSVDLDKNQQLYIVHLELSQHDQLTVNKYIEQTYAKHVDSNDQSVLFGKLLCDMGECESAIKYFLDALECLSDHNNQFRAVYLNNIGVCHNEIGRKDEAFKCYNGALKIYQQINDQRGLSACQHNIASIYHAKGDHRNAIRWALEAFDIRQKDKIEKASTLNLIGCIRLALPDVEAAHNNFQEALQLRLKCLGKINPYHPDIGISYQNLGKVNSRQSSYIDAEANYMRAAEIFRHNYPESHPLVIDITKCLRENQRQLTY